MRKKVNAMAADEKLITVNADRDLFGRLFITANARCVNLMDVLSYELSPVPCALAHQDGSLRKTTKSVLSTIIEEDQSSSSAPCITSTDYLYTRWDGHSANDKSGGAGTFKDLSVKYFFSIFTASLSRRNCRCLEVHIAFDQYNTETSMKAGEQSRRDAFTALEVQIGGPSTKCSSNGGNTSQTLRTRSTSVTINEDTVYIRAGKASSRQEAGNLRKVQCWRKTCYDHYRLLQ